MHLPSNVHADPGALQIAGDHSSHRETLRARALRTAAECGEEIVTPEARKHAKRTAMI
jgi:hypothetical protein